MRKILLVSLSTILASCGWGPKTVSTKDYDIADIKPSESVEELRVYSQMAAKCPGDLLGQEAVVPLGAILLGSAIKQVAAYGKEQVDIAIKYLQSDVKITGKSFLPTANMAPSNPLAKPMKLCVFAVYGKFHNKKNYDSDKSIPTTSNFDPFFLSVPNSRVNEAFRETFNQYRMSGDISPSPTEGLVGKPAFMVELSAVVVAGTEKSSKKYLYNVKPTFLWYPHALHKGVFDRAKRDLTIELGFADVKTVTPLDGFTPGHVYASDDFAARFSLVEGLKTSTANVVTLSIIEGPDKIPSDKALSIINDGIKAKSDDMTKRIDEKHQESE